MGREETRQNSGGKKLLLALLAAVVIVAVVVLITVFVPGSGPKTRSVNIRGIDYVTSLEIEEYLGNVYGYMFVNSDVEEAILEVEDERTSKKIAEFIQEIDTLYPGEHVLELDDYELHIIVDGIEGESELPMVGNNSEDDD